MARIASTNEPMRIGRRVSRTILPVSSPVRMQSDTLRLPHDLVAALRHDAKLLGRTLSEVVAAKLRGPRGGGSR